MARARRNSVNTVRKAVKETDWIARPASRILFPVVGSFWLDWDDPTRAAPAICMIVVRMSTVTKPHRITFGASHQRSASKPYDLAQVMSLLMQTYMLAEMKTGATTMRKYWTTNQMMLYGSSFDESERNM